MDSLNCNKHMCDKNIRSVNDWRKEMLRLRKTLPNFETHPDFVKTAQCKEVFCTEDEEEEDDDADDYSDDSFPSGFFSHAYQQRHHPQPPPQPQPRSPPQPQPRPQPRQRPSTRNNPLNKKTDHELIEELKQLNEDLKDSIDKSLQMQKYRGNALIIIEEKTNKLKELKIVLKDLERHIRIYYDKIEKLQNAVINIEREQLARKQAAPAQEPPKTKKASPKTKNKKASPTTKNKKASPNTKKASPTSFEYDQSKRCPTGYHRNKMTKRCQKK